MRRIIIPLIFVALLTIAAVIPVAASGPDAVEKGGCDYSSNL